MDSQIKPIGFHTYKLLKNSSGISEDEIKQVIEYENRMNISSMPTEALKAYYLKLSRPERQIEIKIKPQELFKRFNECWPSLHQKRLVIDEDVVDNLRVLNRYFAKNEAFANDCHPISSPSLSKGLLIIGDYGLGKTDFMITYRKMLESLAGYSFKAFTANEIVNMYEFCRDDYDKKQFWNQVLTGRCWFDDVLAERTASNFGKVELFKEILEGRYDRRSITYITCNYAEGKTVESTLDVFGANYGSRVYDRLFEIFNVIEWKGKKSFRR